MTKRESPDPTPNEVKRPRLLIVEDEALIAADIELQIQQLGYDVVGIADSGADALALIEETQPDLVLMDIQIRGDMDGIDVAERVRQNNGPAFIYVTSHADAATAERASGTSPYGYVVKPFQTRDMQIAIDVALNRRHAEELARGKNEVVAKTLEGLGDAILAADNDGRVIYMNAMAESLSGWSQADALGRPLVDVAPMESENGAPSTDTGASGVSKNLVLQSKDGTNHPVTRSIVPMLGPGGPDEGFIVTVRGRNREDEREAQQRLVDERVREAWHLESLGALAGGVAHDFNNLLTTIQGNAALALDGPNVDEETRLSLQEIVRAAKEGETLCAQMLIFAGKSNPKMGSVDLRQMLSDAARLVRPLMESTTFALSLPESDELFVHGDQAQLQESVLNLLFNAKEAVGDTSGEVEVSVRLVAATDLPVGYRVGAELPGAQDYVCISVRDSGPGVSQDQVRKIFDPFFTTKFLGRGLGLATARSVVTNHGGAIVIDSSPGRTRFHVILPRIDGDENMAARSPSVPANWDGEGTILVADDEPSVRAIVKRILSKYGFEVVVVNNGSEAVDAVRREPDRFCCALLDTTMPELDGRAACAVLRQLAPSLPIVMMSGYEVTVEVEGYTPSFVHKPFAPEVLAETIRQTLAREAQS